MKINERGFWENNSTEGHGVDQGLMKGLADFFHSNSYHKVVIDIGCGEGSYTKYLNEHGIYCEGYDGNRYTPVITNGLCHVADFSQEQHLGSYEWAMCLEVAEHIPAKYEDIFLDNLHRHNVDGIVISWSIPEFGGDGHVNPKPNSYVIDKFISMGYLYDENSTTILRYSCAEYPNPCWWFGHTIFVFRKGEVNGL